MWFRRNLLLCVLIVIYCKGVCLDVSSMRMSGSQLPEFEENPRNLFMHRPRPTFRSPPIPHRPFQHASLPQGLQVVPLPLKGSDHELVFNVSWNPPVGPALGFTKEYSVVVNSLTKTPDCDTLMCYECCISGRQTWTIVPSISYPVAETCAIKPGCTYQVTLTAHPWDGHTTANMIVELDECVAGVCSCAHASRLPAPLVSAQTISLQGGLFVNVTWSLPPSRNVRLPRGLAKKYYYISIGKQMVTDAHPSPWFTRGTSRKIDAMGTVSSGDQAKWFMLPINDKKDDKQKDLVPDVKLLARVNLIDERGCVGPAGNATAFDPTKENTTSYSAYVLWATLGGVIVVTIAAVVIVSAGAIKKFLRALRPAPVSAPLEPLRLRNAWFALPLNSNNENPSRGQVEQSPLYSHKVFQPPDEATDHWEIHRSRIHLGALIGSGAFGRVHAAQLHMPAGETITVAAKMLNENATNEEMEDFLGEINMLKHVGSHKHVIRLIGCCTLKAPLIALLEHAPRGDLLSLLRSARARRKVDEGSNETRRVDSETNGRPSEVECTTEYTNLSDSDPTLTEEKLCTDELKRNNDHYVAEPALHLDSSTMREYALQVALGMRHLEERGITHRDLAARNILVDGAGLLKVADFGLSRSGIYVHTKAKPVPLRWLAPEAILMSQYSSKSDVWAFAVLLWEIATFGGFPYAELSNHQVPEFLTAGQRLPKPVRASTRLYNLMTECWSEEPQKRPTFAQIVDKLNAQRQLYVDLEIIELFQDEAGLSDNDFSKSSAEWPCGR